VWLETAVTEGVLAVCIRKLRRALDDEAQRPHYIGTVHRRGYRFMAELRVPPAAVGAPDWLSFAVSHGLIASSGLHHP
jgi:DNA-binding winged helix-turn-helix (wHTH) protein